MSPLVLPAPVIAQQAAGGSNLFLLVMVAALALLMFLSFRRSRRVQAEQAALRSSLAPGQEVMTASGIFGTVAAVDETAQRVSLEVAPGVRLQVHLQGVVQAVEPSAAAGAPGDVAPEPASDVASRGTGSTAAPVADAAPLGTDRPAAHDGDPRTDRP